jgi:hypothetical protein
MKLGVLIGFTVSFVAELLEGSERTWNFGSLWMWVFDSWPELG